MVSGPASKTQIYTTNHLNLGKCCFSNSEHLPFKADEGQECNGGHMDDIHLVFKGIQEMIIVAAFS